MSNNNLTKTLAEVSKPHRKDKGLTKVLTATEHIFITYKVNNNLRQRMSIKYNRLFYIEDIVYGALIGGLFYYVEQPKPC